MTAKIIFECPNCKKEVQTSSKEIKVNPPQEYEFDSFPAEILIECPHCKKKNELDI